jgi:ABC-type multidrug transport system fused ATPase/permease subunit
LDEATSALDSESESIILETIQKLRAHMTLIVIAHRMTTILGADQIYVLDDGKITESGSHEELIKNQSLYAELYYSQMQTN